MEPMHLHNPVPQRCLLLREIRPFKSHLHENQVQTYTPGQQFLGLIQKRFHHQFIFVLFLPFLYWFCVFWIESGLLWRHKLGNSRTIIKMRFSFAVNFGLLFLTVNAQNNCVQYLVRNLYGTKLMFFLRQNCCYNPSPMTIKTLYIF